MKPTDRIIYERGYGPGDGDSHVERVEPSRTVSPSPEQSGELVKRLRNYVAAIATPPETERDLRVGRAMCANIMSEAADALESAQAEIARLTAALEQCRDKFAEYASLHLAKGTRDGIIKAQANADMANLCGAALKGNQP